MKKFLTALLCLFQISSVSHAGLITHTDYTAGSVITAAGQNTNENAVFNEFNGNIESANIKDGTIVSADIAAATIAKSNLAATVLGDISSYRRPVLVYNSGTVVNIETGLTGTSGQAAILFPDGSYRTDSTAGRIQCNLAQVAVLSGTAQSGLLSGTVATNTWYAIYATKQTDSATNIVAIATTTLPVQANYTALNTALGTSGWIYIGMIRYGDQSGTSNVILAFIQAGNLTVFQNEAVGDSTNGNGLRLTHGTGSSVTWTYVAGTTSNQIPNNVLMGQLQSNVLGSGGTFMALTAQTSGTLLYAKVISGGATSCGGAMKSGMVYLPNGGIVSAGTSQTMDIFLTAFVDSALGVGANPLL